MISEFTVENFGPFRDEVRLDFRATKLKDSEDTVLTAPDGERLVSSVALFGQNASGKSCVIHALNQLSNLVRFQPLPDAGLDHNPFRLSPETRNAPTRMRIRFYEGDALFDYAVEYDSAEIIRESLHCRSGGTRRKVFTRERGRFSCAPSGSKVRLKDLTYMTAPNATLVSVGARFNHDACLRVNRAVSGFCFLSGDMSAQLSPTVAEMERDPEFKGLIEEAMYVADFGIDGLRGSVERRTASGTEGPEPGPVPGLMMAVDGHSAGGMQLFMRHRVDVEGVTDDDRTFPYTMESNGTVRMMSMMGPVIRTLRSGGVLAIDEFGAFLDNDICRWIVGLFSSGRNRNGAQLIFNTHNQLLMDTSRLLRRDQVYFVSKDRTTGASEMYSLSDFSIRKGKDPRKDFELGRFGARPLILDEGWMEDGEGADADDK